MVSFHQHLLGKSQRIRWLFAMVRNGVIPKVASSNKSKMTRDCLWTSEICGFKDVNFRTSWDDFPSPTIVFACFLLQNSESESTRFWVPPSMQHKANWCHECNTLIFHDFPGTLSMIFHIPSDEFSPQGAGSTRRRPGLGRSQDHFTNRLNIKRETIWDILWMVAISESPLNGCLIPL